MSRHSRRHRRHSTAELPTSPRVVTVPVLTPNAYGAYQGAMHSPDRGYIYYPSMDPRQEVDSWSRNEMARRTHFLVNNMGLAKRARNGLTNMVVGTGLNPQAKTTDSEWNELAEKAYNRRARSKITYDITGRSNGRQSQKLIVSTKFEDGGAAVALTKSASGGALRKLYSAIQIGNDSQTQLDQSYWNDGIREDSNGRAIAYRFPGTNGQFVDLPAASVLFHANADRIGSRHGATIFHHAINKMIDIGEVNAAVMAGIKASSQIGYYLTNEAATTSRGPTFQMRNKQVTTPTGEVIKVRQVYAHGGEVLNLQPGQDLKQLLDQRPHPNSREFIEDLVRDIAYGAGVSPELLWNIIKLGGANVRFALADAQVFIASEQQDLVDNVLALDWTYTIACEMQEGRLRPCQDPEWWKHGWMPPARITVDFGRDGKMYLEFYQAGLLTAERFFAMSGQDAREETIKHLDFVAWRKAEIAKRGLTYSEAYPSRPGAPTAPDAAPVDPEEDPNDVPQNPKINPDDDEMNDL